MVLRASLRSALVVLVSVGSLVASASCAALIGLEPYAATGGGDPGHGGSNAGGSTPHGGSGPQGGGGSTSSSTGSGGCPGACVTAPAGWKGPILLGGDDCAGGKILDTGVVGPTSCDGCSCNAKAECTLTLDEFDATTDTNCGKPPVALASSTGRCVPVPATTATDLIRFKVDETGPGTCALAAGCVTPMPTKVSLCALAACDAGTCVPTGAKACVYDDTPLAAETCPAGFDALDETAFDAVTVDTCACGLPSGADCTPHKIQSFQQASCAGFGTTLGQCEPTTAKSIRYLVENEGTCSAPTPQFTTQNRRFRVCCAP